MQRQERNNPRQTGSIELPQSNIAGRAERSSKARVEEEPTTRERARSEGAAQRGMDELAVALLARVECREQRAAIVESSTLADRSLNVCFLSALGCVLCSPIDRSNECVAVTVARVQSLRRCVRCSLPSCNPTWSRSRMSRMACMHSSSHCCIRTRRLHRHRRTTCTHPPPRTRPS